MQRDYEMAIRLAQAVRVAGGTAYYVGGCVRDTLMGFDIKDIDIEIHGIAPAVLEQILDTLGTRIEIGKSFGIYGLKGYDLDIAMPRKETCLGRGHKSFAVDVDPFLGTEKASLRRDFTINAMMQDVLTGEIIDHHSGQEHLSNRILRHVNDTSFGEDPLRVLRGAQFAARFQFIIAPETIVLCKTMELSDLSKERVFEEMKKALLKADKPSIFFEALRSMEQLSVWYPELNALIGVPQNPVHHPEGDVWTHTMMVLDHAAAFRSQTENPLGFMLCALTHDFGKAVCTENIGGVVHAYAHETKGLRLIEGFLRRLTTETALIRYVLNLSELHMKPGRMAADHSSIKSTNRLFDSAISPIDLILISIADGLGRGGALRNPAEEKFLWERYETYQTYMARPFVTGKDLLDAGLIPDKHFKEILAYAHKLRLAGVEKSAALKQTLSYAKSSNFT